MRERPCTARGRAIVCALGLLLVFSPSARADALGEARLFFTSAERDPGSPRPAERAPDRDSATTREPARGSDAGCRGPACAGETRPVVVRRRLGFGALLRVGERIRAIVDGVPCLVESGGSALQCRRVPEGIGSLALAPDGRRLVVTFADGRRVRLRVGETVPLP